MNREYRIETRKEFLRTIKGAAGLHGFQLGPVCLESLPCAIDEPEGRKTSRRRGRRSVKPAIALSIRIPPPLYGQIKQQAEAEQRTINSQIIFLLTKITRSEGK